MQRDNVADIYDLTPLQQGLLFHTLYEPEAGLYVNQLECRLDGPLDVELFHQAWQALVDQHPILRTSFHWKRLKVPQQVVHRRCEIPFEVHDWQDREPGEQQAAWEALLAADRTQGFVMDQAPLARVNVAQLAADSHRCVWSHHHILTDGWSLPILLREVVTCYESLRRGVRPQLPTRRPLRDYVAYLRAQDAADTQAFWREKLAGLKSPTSLGIDRTSAAPGEFSEQRTTLAESLSTQIRGMARQQRLTVSTLFQAAWARVLACYHGGDDVLLGVTVAGRSAELSGIEEMVGPLINTLPVRVRIDRDLSVSLWLEQQQREMAKLRRYEHSPLIEIQAASEIPRGRPLFDSLFVFENYPLDPQATTSAGSLTVSETHCAERTSLPLNVVVGPGREFELRVVYDQARFSADAIARLLEHLEHVVTQFVENPGRPLGEVRVPTPLELHRVVEQFNDTAVDVPENTVVGRFLAWAKRTPQAVAIETPQRSWTYQELDQASNNWAAQLLELGVQGEEIVGVLLERGFEQFAVTLGILKSGCAFLPLDLRQPEARLKSILKDAGAKVVITSRELAAKLRQRHDILCVEDTGHIAEPAELPLLDLHQLAYVIYTSGSTGQPKGVAIEQVSWNNLAAAQQRVFRLAPATRVMQFAPACFDAWTWEFSMALTSGGTLLVPPAAEILPGRPLARSLAEQQAHVLTIPPSALALLPEVELPKLHTLVVAGEVCSSELVDRFAPATRFINAYGPTEATVDVTWGECLPGEEKPSIGRPIANHRVYLLDAQRKPVPIGVPGEMYVAGEGLARGYLNRPELTAERFVEIELSPTRRERMFRTGDQARFRPDGQIEFLGRLDHQVKHRGLRIELGEIEHALQQHPRVRQAVANVWEEDPGSSQLVAYYCLDIESADVPAAELRDFLHQRLPEWMVPDAFMQVAEFRRTASDKIDRQALPRPEHPAAQLQAEYVSPRNELETALAAAWAKVFNLPQVGIHDRFFDLGGHSLLAVRLLGEMETAVGHEIPLRHLLEAQTIAELALRLAGPDELATQLPLVVLQAGTPGETPVVCVHPAGGSPFCYAPLAEAWGEGVPLWGLQCPGLEGDAIEEISIAQLAEQYRAAIENCHTGPVRLVGWSLGGLIAYEMAVQWSRLANAPQVELLLLDTLPPESELSDSPSNSAWDRRMFAVALVQAAEKLGLPQINADLLATVEPDVQLDACWQAAQRSGLALPPAARPLAERLLAVYRRNVQAARRYQPDHLPTQVHYVQATGLERELPPNAASAKAQAVPYWTNLAELEVFDVPATHSELLDPPGVQPWAKWWQAQWKQSSPTGTL